MSNKENESIRTTPNELPLDTIQKHDIHEAIDQWPEKLRELIVKQQFSGKNISNEANTNKIISCVWDGLAENERKRGPDALNFYQPTFNVTTGVLTVDGQSISLEGSQYDVLKILVKYRAASFSILKEESHSPAPHKILHKLCNKFPKLQKYISFPGKKGEGGYSTKIILVE